MKLAPICAAALTEKQRDVAKLLLCGLNRQASAAVLHVSTDTVRNRERALCRRMGFKGLNRIRLAIALLCR